MNRKKGDSQGRAPPAPAPGDRHQLATWKLEMRVPRNLPGGLGCRGKPSRFDLTTSQST